jgi:hypothetical protein
MYAFVHVEKTGGTTMLSILRRSFGLRHCDLRMPLAKRSKRRPDERTPASASELRRVKRLYRNLLGISGHAVKAYSDLELAAPDIRYVTILRDPVARYRSHFLNRGLNHSREDFEAWVSSDWTHNWQTKMIAGEANAQKAIDLVASRFGFVGITERFDESLVLLGEWFGDESFDPVYRPKNRLAEKRRPRDIARERYDMSYLDSVETSERLLELNAEDVRLFDFCTRVVYADQVVRYPGDLEGAVTRLQARNREATRLKEPMASALLRNYVYKPLIHCRLM